MDSFMNWSHFNRLRLSSSSLIAYFSPTPTRSKGGPKSVEDSVSNQFFQALLCPLKTQFTFTNQKVCKHPEGLVEPVFWLLWFLFSISQKNRIAFNSLNFSFPILFSYCLAMLLGLKSQFFEILSKECPFQALSAAGTCNFRADGSAQLGPYFYLKELSRRSTRRSTQVSCHLRACRSLSTARMQEFGSGLV